MPRPSFDTWTTIFLFAAIQGIFVSLVLFFGRKEQKSATSLLGCLILLFSITLTEYVLYWTHYISGFPHMMNVSSGFPFLFGPVLYFYFRIIFQHIKISVKDVWHFIPFVVFLMYNMPLYLSTAEVKRNWLKGDMVPPSLFNWPENFSGFHHWFPWLMMVHMSVYAIYIQRAFLPYSRTHAEVRSWLNWLTGLFALFVLSFASYYILVRFPFFNSSWDYMISFSMMFFIYFIAWFGYQQPRIFSGFTLQESIIHPMRYRNSALDATLSRDILNNLDRVMQEKKLYRESDLRLEKLAETIGVSRHHLSQVINEQTGMSFFEYINNLRIKEAMELLAATSKKELNVIDVAYSVGFNNKVSFNTTFKKVTGKTPTAFRNEGVMVKEDKAIP